MSNIRQNGKLYYLKQLWNVFITSVFEVSTHLKYQMSRECQSKMINHLYALELSGKRALSNLLARNFPLISWKDSRVFLGYNVSVTIGTKIDMHRVDLVRKVSNQWNSGICSCSLKTEEHFRVEGSRKMLTNKKISYLHINLWNEEYINVVINLDIHSWNSDRAANGTQNQITEALCIFWH